MRTPCRKHKWHIDNDLYAKITADVVHNGERGFHIHILWLYKSSIRKSYRGFTDFGGICSGIPQLNTASGVQAAPSPLFQKAKFPGLDFSVCFRFARRVPGVSCMLTKAEFPRSSSPNNFFLFNDRNYLYDCP